MSGKVSTSIETRNFNANMMSGNSLKKKATEETKTMKTEIKKLSDYQHVRLRTEMYLGSREIHNNEILLLTDEGLKIKEIQLVPAIWAAFREILDNAVDEIIAHGNGNKIEINYDKENMIFEISDNGKGIPIRLFENENIYIPTMVFTHMKSGRNFGERNEVTGTNGIGACVVNFCSEFMEIETMNNNKKFYQKFEEGKGLVDDLITHEPEIKKIKTKKTGTKIKFKLSSEVFKNYIFPWELLESHIRFLSFFNKQTSFIVNGKKIKPDKNFKEYFKTDFITKFSLNDKNDFVEMFVITNINKDKDYYYSIVNNISAFDNGKHVDIFKKNFFGSLAEFLNKKYKNINISRNILTKNVVVIFNIRTKEAFFDSQSKTRFVNDLPILNKFTPSKIQLNNFYISHKEWVDEIIKQLIETNKEKEHDLLRKTLKKNKKIKVSKLIDANSSERKNCILFITEGDSALSNLIAVRNPSIHAGFPLRGKIPNVMKMKTKDLIKNKELAELMKIIGLNPFEKADRKKLNYGKIFIAHDADQDGYNIGSLVVNFFYNFWPELFDPRSEPYFYIFQTPFIIAEKGKEKHYWYMSNYSEFKPEKWKGYSITRAKGLGSLTFEHWKDCINNPHLTPLIDDNNLKNVLNMIFDQEKADIRKKWISGDYVIGNQ